MPAIKAIQTKWRGRLFRSRLEARYAVLFDTLKIQYEYEPEGFVLSDGTCYLPDFWLSQFRWFCEVKPGWIDSNNKAMAFVRESGHGVLLLDGEPNTKAYTGFQMLRSEDDTPTLIDTPFSLDIDGYGTRRENRFWAQPEENHEYSEEYRNAVVKALSERFS